MANRKRSTRRKTTRKRRASGPHWGSLATGFGAGLAIALVIWIYGLPELRRTTPTSTQSSTEPESSQPTPKAKVKPLEVTGADYDFYDLLPDQEVTVSTERASGNTRPSSPSVTISEPGSYIIQAGSFQNPDDADRMRATVAMLGMRAQIQPVEVREQQFHRVIIGPLTELSQLNDYRNRLRREGIDIQVRKRAP